MLRRANTLEKNRRIEPCKVGKSNGIEIQINATLNDAYRISQPWKGRKRERKGSVMNCRKEYWKERRRRRWITVFDPINSTSCCQALWNIFTDTDPILMQFYLWYIIGVGNVVASIGKFGRLNYYEKCQRSHNFYIH